MRDIRSDLEERAHIIQEQMRAAYAHFERMAQQLQSERDARVSGLKETLAMIDKLIQFETGTVAKVVTLENAPASQPSLADRMKAVNDAVSLERAKFLTVAWRSNLLPARCFTRTVSLGWHHFTSVAREDLNEGRLLNNADKEQQALFREGR